MNNEKVHAGDSGSQRKLRSINDSIGIMLRTYTRAKNKQEQMSSSLFRQETKSICVTCQKGLVPISMNSMYGRSINIESKRNYPHNCFEYIHQNPVKAGLVENITDWQFSSARDYFANRKGNLINRHYSCILTILLFLAVNLRIKEFINSYFIREFSVL